MGKLFQRRLAIVGAAILSRSMLKRYAVAADKSSNGRVVELQLNPPRPKVLKKPLKRLTLPLRTKDRGGEAI